MSPENRLPEPPASSGEFSRLNSNITPEQGKAKVVAMAEKLVELVKSMEQPTLFWAVCDLPKNLSAGGLSGSVVGQVALVAQIAKQVPRMQEQAMGQLQQYMRDKQEGGKPDGAGA